MTLCDLCVRSALICTTYIVIPDTRFWILLIKFWMFSTLSVISEFILQLNLLFFITIWELQLSNSQRVVFFFNVVVKVAYHFLFFCYYNRFYLSDLATCGVIAIITTCGIICNIYEVIYFYPGILLLFL